MASLRQDPKTKRYYVRWRDVDGQEKQRAVGTDKKVAEQIRREIETRVYSQKHGLIDPKTERRITESKRPIEEHVADFERWLATKGNVPQHISMTLSRVRRIIKLTGSHQIAGLILSKVQESLAQLQKEKSLATESVNHHIRAIKSFASWLHKDGRTESHILIGLSLQNSAPDRKRSRRALTPTEASKLIEAAEASAESFAGLDGPTRAAAYRLAFSTGLRRNELNSLTPESFDLNQGTVKVEAAYSKHRRADTIPLPQSVLPWLSGWLSKRPPSQPLFRKLPHKTSKMIRRDLDAAGIPYRTSEGVFDFHAIRGTYITEIVGSGADIKTAMSLARHSSPALTLNVYAKAQEGKLRDAANSLPPISCLNFDTDLDVAGRNQPQPNDETDQDKEPSPCSKSLNSKDLSQPDVPVRMVEGVGRAGIEPATPGFSGSCPYCHKSFCTNDLRKAANASCLPLGAQLDRVDLALVVESWDLIPASVRRGIIAMVRDARSS